MKNLFLIFLSIITAILFVLSIVSGIIGNDLMQTIFGFSWMGSFIILWLYVLMRHKKQFNDFLFFVSNRDVYGINYDSLKTKITILKETIEKEKDGENDFTKLFFFLKSANPTALIFKAYKAFDYYAFLNIFFKIKKETPFNKMTDVNTKLDYLPLSTLCYDLTLELSILWYYSCVSLTGEEFINLVYSYFKCKNPVNINAIILKGRENYSAKYAVKDHNSSYFKGIN